MLVLAGGGSPLGLSFYLQSEARSRDRQHCSIVGANTVSKDATWLGTLPAGLLPISLANCWKLLSHLSQTTMPRPP